MVAKRASKVSGVVSRIVPRAVEAALREDRPAPWEGGLDAVRERGARFNVDAGVAIGGAAGRALGHFSHAPGGVAPRGLARGCGILHTGRRRRLPPSHDRPPHQRRHRRTGEQTPPGRGPPCTPPSISAAPNELVFLIIRGRGSLWAGIQGAGRIWVESRDEDAAMMAEAHRLIAAAGLDRVRYRNLSGGIAAIHSAWRL